MKIQKKLLWAILIVLVLSTIPLASALAWNGGVDSDPDCDGVTVTADPENPYWQDHSGMTQVKWVLDNISGTGFFPWNGADSLSGTVNVRWVKYTSTSWGLFWTNTGVPHTQPYSWSERKPNNCKIKICHATGSLKNPYVEIQVDESGLNGHGDHTGDIIPMPANGCPDGPTASIEIDYFNNCDIWERSARLLLDGEGASSFVVVDSGYWTDNVSQDLPAWSGTVTFADGPAEYNGTYPVSFPAMAADQCEVPPEVTLCNLKTGELETFPYDQVPDDEQYTEDLSQCEEPEDPCINNPRACVTVTPTPKPEDTMVVCLPGQYRAQSVPTNYTGEYSKNVIWDGKDSVCWATVCNPENGEQKTVKTQREIDALVEAGWVDPTSPLCVVRTPEPTPTPVPPPTEVPPTGEAPSLLMDMWMAIVAFFHSLGL